MTVCQVCKHPDRVRIELHKLSGASLDKVVMKFPDIHRDALHRHMKSHLGADERQALIAEIPIRELAKRAAEEGGSVLDHLTVIRNVVMRALLGAAESSDRVGTASLAGRAVEVLNALGKLTGEIASIAAVTNIQNNLNIFQAPDFCALETMLVQRLQPYPDALAAVLDGLRELEGRSTPEATVATLRSPQAAIEHRAGH